MSALFTSRPVELTADILLRLWEVGSAQHPLDRALTILTVSETNQTRAELARLPSGRRDERLLVIYERTFGSQLAGQGRCPQCNEEIEFTLNAGDLLAAATAGDGTQPLIAASAGYEVTYRLPNSFDLATVARLSDVAEARQRLLQECIVQATYEGVTITPERIPEAIIDLVIEQIAAHDPLAVIELNLICPACGCQWSLLFDIVAFLWGKIEAQAQRLLREVHTLAQAYGWREADILALNPARRQAYLEMVS